MENDPHVLATAYCLALHPSDQNRHPTGGGPKLGGPHARLHSGPPDGETGADQKKNDQGFHQSKTTPAVLFLSTVSHQGKFILSGTLADPERPADLEEGLLADPPHVHEILDTLEGPVLLPVFDDSLGIGLADPGQFHQFFHIGRIDVDGFRRHLDRFLLSGRGWRR